VEHSGGELCLTFGGRARGLGDGSPPAGSRGRAPVVSETKSSKSASLYIQDLNTVFYDTKCVVGICECVVGFVKLQRVEEFLDNTKSLIILSTGTGENRFVLLL